MRLLLPILIVSVVALPALEMPQDMAFSLSGGVGNASLEFRDAAGRLRPAIFAAGFPADGGELTVPDPDHLTGTIRLEAKALNLREDDHRRRVLGERMVEKTVDGKTVSEAPAVSLLLRDLGPLTPGEGKGAFTATVAGVLTFAGREVPLTGTIQVVVRKVQQRFDRISLHATFSTQGAALGLERDRDARILIDAWCEALPPAAGKAKGRRK